MKKTLLTLAVASALSVSAQAEQFWADNSVSYLYGSSYEGTADDTYSTVTLEHASGHSWGGLFYFVDIDKSGAVDNTYSEFSPTYTLAKMDGFVTSVSAAYTMENSEFNDNHLFGATLGLKVPGMNFVNASLFQAYNGDGSEDNLFSVVYNYSNGNLTVDGFMDYRFGNDNGEDNLNLTPQITYDLAPMLKMKGKLKVGIEYSNWSNKFGVDVLDQSAVSLLVKAHL
jgi:nucleoside-specific outer membrane channel protein Tsx